MTNIFVTEFTEFSEKHFGTTQLCHIHLATITITASLTTLISHRWIVLFPFLNQCYLEFRTTDSHNTCKYIAILQGIWEAEVDFIWLTSAKSTDYLIIAYCSWSCSSPIEHLLDAHHSWHSAMMLPMFYSKCAKTYKTLQYRDLKLKYCTKTTNYLLKLANQIHSHRRHESFDKRVIPVTMNEEYNTSLKSPSLFANWPT